MLKKIVIIDSDLDYINEMEEVLKSPDFLVIRKNDTIDLINFVKDNTPDLIIIEPDIKKKLGKKFIQNLEKDQQLKELIIISSY